MSEWKKVRLGEIIEFQRGYDLPHSKMVDGVYPVMGSNGIIGWHNEFTTEAPSVTIGRSGSIGIPHLLKCRSWSHNTVLFVKDYKGNDPEFIYYLLFTLKLSEYGGGSAVPTLNRNILHDLMVRVPPLPVQRRIAEVLPSLDDKIENNRKICANLEAQAQAIFKSWFVDFEPFGGKMPQGWKMGKLTDIATYLNGLAMQKFRPPEGGESLPVLKIKELRQGFCDSDSERCTATVDEKYIIHDGDIIFSWSGSLLVDLWCGSDAGLNQHLFKVMPTGYPKWFAYYWTKHHLGDFVKIAADKATTMGHITREHLEGAKAVFPDARVIDELDDSLAPMVDLIIEKRLESRSLAALRDALLPKLMSGEIDVEKVEVV